MALWKKLNPETGEYEGIPGSAVSGGVITAQDTVGVADAYTVYPMADVASGVGSSYWATIYTVNDLLKGDIITTKRQFNGQGGIISGDGNDLTGNIHWAEFVYGTLVLDRDYKQLTVCVNKGDETLATVSRRTADVMTRPGYKGAFVPTVDDGDDDTVFTTASKKWLHDRLGGSYKRAKAKLEGRVMVTLGDSYTKGMHGVLSALAEKYGMILDNRGIVSSSICGDTTGNKGFQPMWNRASGIVTDYTAEGGYAIDGVAYAAGDVGIITFMGGANDAFGPETWIGSGPADTDTGHIYGAMNHIYSVLTEAFPNAQVITILQPSSFSRTVNRNTDPAAGEVIDDATAQIWGFMDAAAYRKMTDIQLSNYAMTIKEEAIRRMAWAYGSPVVDAFGKFPTMFNPGNRAKYWQSDKLHLTAAGYQLVADLLEQDGILAVFGK